MEKLMQQRGGRYDLAVIGGGPAGLAAAITAGKAGARVLLLERGKFPRHKVCGEFVSGEALGLLGALLDSAHAELLKSAIRISEARVYLDGRSLSAPVSPAAASIARLDMDPALWASSQAVGVEAQLQVNVRSVDGEGPFRVTTDSGVFEADALINSSGRWSNLTASVPPDSNERWLGVKAHFAETEPDRSVDLYFFEGGYCGVQPVDVKDDRGGGGRVNACAMVRADVATNLDEVFERHPALRERSKRWRRLSEPVATSPLIFRKPVAVRGGMLMAGDAAGFVDPFVGDGISLALRSGALAAESLIPFFRGAMTLAGAVEAYATTYEQRLGPIFRASSQIRRVLALPKRVRRPLLFVFQKTPGLARYLVGKTR